MIIRTLQIVAAIGTVLTGLVSLIRPRAVQGFTGLKAEGGRGITESLHAIVPYLTYGSTTVEHRHEVIGSLVQTEVLIAGRIL